MCTLPEMWWVDGKYGESAREMRRLCYHPNMSLAAIFDIILDCSKHQKENATKSERKMPNMFVNFDQNCRKL